MNEQKHAREDQQDQIPEPIGMTRVSIGSSRKMYTRSNIETLEVSSYMGIYSTATHSSSNAKRLTNNLEDPCTKVGRYEGESVKRTAAMTGK